MELSQKHRDQWVQFFRENFNEADVDSAKYTDDEILIIAKGVMCPILCKQLGMTSQWMFELYWNALLMMKPQSTMVDADLFKNRAKNNTN